jgi:hypothetical protein
MAIMPRSRIMTAWNIIRVAQIMRDVFDMAPAQRLDLKLETVNDGKHSYGEGDWLIHDHREKGITTNGMAEGGSMSSIVYKSYLNEAACPRSVISALISIEFFHQGILRKKTIRSGRTWMNGPASDHPAGNVKVDALQDANLTDLNACDRSAGRTA